MFHAFVIICEEFALQSSLYSNRLFFVPLFFSTLSNSQKFLSKNILPNLIKRNETKLYENSMTMTKKVLTAPPISVVSITKDSSRR